MKSESDTPRTDANMDDARNVALEFTCQTPGPIGNCYVVPVEFARELERENSILYDFINREMKMTASDPRIKELVKRINK